MDARAGNDRVADKAEQLRFLSRVPMLCECEDPNCRAVVMIALSEYREIRRQPDLILTAPGHDAAGEPLRTTPTYDVRRAGPENGDGNGHGERRSA